MGHTSRPAGMSCQTWHLSPRRSLRTLLAMLAMSAISAMPAGAQQLPDGPGKAELQKVCGLCHQAERSAAVRLTREGWEGVIGDMIARGARGYGRGVRGDPRLPVEALPRRCAPAAEHQQGQQHRARERGRADPEGSGGAAQMAAERRPLQIARRPEEGARARLQENRGAKGLPGVLRSRAPAASGQERQTVPRDLPTPSRDEAG